MSALGDAYLELISAGTTTDADRISAALKAFDVQLAQCLEPFDAMVDDTTLLGPDEWKWTMAQRAFARSLLGLDERVQDETLELLYSYGKGA